MSSPPSIAPEIIQPLPGILRPKPVASWLAIGVAILMCLICWGTFFGLIEPAFEGSAVPHVEADSTTYFQMAGIIAASQSNEVQLLSFSGNLLGPVLIARTLRSPFFVVIFNFFLLWLMVHAVRQIPGARRRYFLLLFFLNAESFVAIVTLNKEILAAAGMIAFAVAITVPSKRKRYLMLAAVLSLMARWEQLAIMLIYLLLTCRFSPFRNKPKLSLAFVLAMLTVAYVAIVRYSGIDVSGFVTVAEGAGLVAQLDTIQGKFGLPLVIVPKILMNLFNRLLLPGYFLSSDYFSQDFSDLQNSVIIHLHSLAVLILSIAAFAKGRLGVSRPIPYIIYLYLMITAVSPFIQPRYEFPVFVLLCLQLSISPSEFSTAPSRRRISLLPILSE